MSRINEVDERARQRALDAYRLADTLPETAYDDIVHVASALCAVPTALITLVDRERQWFKARIGIDVDQTPRDVAFCDHAIRTPATPLVVNDASQDLRFAGNPLVTGDPGIRFYAGVPLRAPGGEALGTVCVIDRVPRTLDDAQLAGLQALARIAVALMEAHRERLQRVRNDSERSFREASRKARLASSGEGVGAVAIVQLDAVAALRQRAGEGIAARLPALLETALGAQLGDGDIVGRHGEHELLLVFVDAAAAEERLARIHRALATTLAGDAASVSIGAAYSAGPGQPLESLFLRADEALASARDAGGNRVAVIEA